MARVTNIPKNIAKVDVAVEGQSAEKCPGRHKRLRQLSYFTVCKPLPLSVFQAISLEQSFRSRITLTKCMDHFKDFRCLYFFSKCCSAYVHILYMTTQATSALKEANSHELLQDNLVIMMALWSHTSQFSWRMAFRYFIIHFCFMLRLTICIFC